MLFERLIFESTDQSENISNGMFNFDSKDYFSLNNTTYNIKFQIITNEEVMNVKKKNEK